MKLSINIIIILFITLLNHKQLKCSIDISYENIKAKIYNGNINFIKNNINESNVNKIKNGIETTLLMQAAIYEKPEIVKIFIDKDADINAQNSFKWTALICCARNGNLDICKILLEHVADQSLKSDSGDGALEVAQESLKLLSAKTSYLQIIDLLEKSLSDINSCDLVNLTTCLNVLL